MAMLPEDISMSSAQLSRRRFLGLTAAVAGSAAVLSACGAGGGAGSSSSKMLTAVCEAGGKGELAPIVAGYKQQTGVTVNLVELPYAGLYDRMNSELSSGAPTFDFAVCNAIWIPQFAPTLQPLDEMVTASMKADVSPATLAQGSAGGKYYGIPQWTNAEILLYRKDLFEDSKEAAAFKQQYGYELAPPTTWQNFTDVARFFTRPASGGKPALYGTDVKAAVAEDWLSHVLQAGSPGVVLDDSGQVIIDNAEHLAALKFHSDLTTKYRVCPAGVPQVDWVAAQNLFNQGKTSMMRFWAHAYRQIPSDSPVHGKVGTAPMIAGPAGIGAIPGPWYLVIPKAASKTSQVKDFISYAYAHNVEGINSTLGLAARNSAYRQYENKPGYESFNPLLTTLNAPHTKAEPGTTKWQQINDTVLVPMLQKSVVPGADYAALLAAARTQVKALVQ